MQKLSKSLQESLGSDTGDLAFRVGLHSGPVTAGVLRGQKGRFQLFGDTGKIIDWLHLIIVAYPLLKSAFVFTVNTASRMESTGVRNKIQVSQATADLLTAGGFHKWLTPREDLVHAKGKGTLQTYFVNVTSNGSVCSSQSTCTMSDYSFSPVHQDTSSGTDSGVEGEMSGTRNSQQYDELVEV